MIVGKTVAGKYIIEELIRSLSFYDTYVARVLNTDRRVIFKWVKRELVEPGHTIKKIKPNLAVIASIRNPGLSSLRDFGEDESVYVVEDFNDGALLSDIIAKAGGINSLQALNLGIKIVDALSAAHSKGVIHGQLTPESVVVSGDLTPKISDFYLLTSLSSELKTTAEFQGRDIRYCSPEIIAGGKSTPESDVYSVGVILYELLTGVLPFEKENSLALALEKIQVDVKSPRELNPDVPKLLESVILKCIKRNPDSRYKNAMELLSELYLCRSSLMRSSVAETFNPAVVEKKEEPVREETQTKESEVNIPVKKEVLEKDATLNDIVSKRTIIRTSAGDVEESNYTKEKDTIEKGAEKIAAPADHSREGENIRETKEEKKSSKKMPKGLVPFIAAFGSFLVIVLILWIVIMKIVGGGPALGTVVVPSLLGKSVVEAKSTLGNANLVAVIREKMPSDEIPQGYIMAQQPEAGIKVKAGREVALIVSSGPEKLRVPRLIGLKVEDAEQQIKNQQFRVGQKKTEY
ncbi:MAG TPA: protein kinase, partial [bacterium]|nr:protein kinase [bacterium]